MLCDILSFFKLDELISHVSVMFQIIENLRFLTSIFISKQSHSIENMVVVQSGSYFSALTKKLTSCSITDII